MCQKNINILEKIFMERLLNSVGKMCFVEYFVKFKNQSIQSSELVEILHEENGYSIKACQTRVSKARKIIENGRSCDALEIIIKAQRVDESTRLKAIRLFGEYCK